MNTGNIKLRILYCRIRWAERGVGRTRQGEESSRTGERMKYEVGEG